MAGKPVVEVAVTGIDSVFVDIKNGLVKVLFETTGRQEIAISLPAEVVSLLETKLAEVREEQRSRSRPQ